MPLPAFHPRNRHQGHYDFTRLVAAAPALAPHVRANAHGEMSIDFADAAAVTALNAALLQDFYGIQGWALPTGKLCPPVPGRADYIHHLADLLAGCNGGRMVKTAVVLDIGTGANCIYPLIAASEYGWQVVGSELNPESLVNAQAILAANPALAKRISLRQQTDAAAIFKGVLQEGEWFDVSLCNPPFHASAQAGLAGSARKWRNLGKGAPAAVKPDSDLAGAVPLNFGGQDSELWCPGGEPGFIDRMIAESSAIPTRCFWFTTLVSQAAHLPALVRALKAAGVQEQRTVNMSQGQKQSRLLAWTFLNPTQQAAWRNVRWG